MKNLKSSITGLSISPPKRSDTFILGPVFRFLVSSYMFPVTPFVSVLSLFLFRPFPSLLSVPLLKNLRTLPVSCTLPSSVVLFGFAGYCKLSFTEEFLFLYVQDRFKMLTILGANDFKILL